MATSRIQVTEGSGKNLATNSFSEDAVTKEVSRVALNNSVGTEIGTQASPLYAQATMATLPVQASQVGTWTIQPGNTPNTTAWLVTMPTLPVEVGSHAVTNAGTFAVQAGQTGTWTVQPGNTPNTVGWLVTLATVSARSTITNVLTLATGSRTPIAQYRPTLLSLADQGYTNFLTDIFGNLRVNTDVSKPNSTSRNRFLTFASMASLMAAPGAGKRLVVREMDFSANATVSIKLVEDHAGTPATVWGPHYFLPYAGAIKTNCYLPLTANKSLGVDITGGTFDSTVDVRVETENV